MRYRVVAAIGGAFTQRARTTTPSVGASLPSVSCPMCLYDKASAGLAAVSVAASSSSAGNHDIAHVAAARIRYAAVMVQAIRAISPARRQGRYILPLTNRRWFGKLLIRGPSVAERKADVRLDRVGFRYGLSTRPTISCI